MQRENSPGPAASALIVDDDAFMRDLLHEMLAGLGLTRIGKAGDGAQALGFLRELSGTEPDILICDLAMPAMDGVEFLRHLAAAEFSGGIVLLSGTSPRILYTAEQLGRAHGLRMLGILEKPVSLEALMRVLESNTALGRKDAGKAAVHLTADEIREGIRRGCVTVHFQPKVALASRQVVGVECLARWQDPERGLLPPKVFIDAAEQAGLIGDITRIVFRLAAGQAGAWKRQGHPLRVSVNLSMSDIDRLDLPELLAGWADEAGLANDSLMLELTESRLMGDQKLNLDIIARLRLKGFGLSIDDFGTGYSTLDKLKNLPFTELKIDRLFVNGAGSDPTAHAILESSVHLGRALGLTLVAEGVETQEDWSVVAALGIDEVQGYFVSRPMEAAALIEWKSGWEADATLDIDRLRAIVGGDPATLDRMLETFLFTARQILHELTAARSRRSPASMAELAHKLKAGAGSIGARLLAAACQALENAGHAGDMKKCELLADEIKRHFALVSARIEAQRGDLP